MTLASHAFLVQDVTAPPPALLSQNIDVYASQVSHASGAVIVEFLKYGGYPEMQWQRAARNVKASRFIEVLAYSFHLVSQDANSAACRHMQSSEC